MLREQGEQAGSKGSELAPQVYGSMRIWQHAYMVPGMYGAARIRHCVYTVPRVYCTARIRRRGSEGERTSHLVKVSLPDILFKFPLHFGKTPMAIDKFRNSRFFAASTSCLRVHSDRASASAAASALASKIQMDPRAIPSVITSDATAAATAATTATDA